jgi:3-oxoadipate enol-lactonase
MRIQTRDTVLQAVEQGPAGAPCLLLAHGIATDHRLWQEVAAILAAEFRVIAYDCRGHGGSDAPAGPYTLAQLGADAIGLMDALGIGKAHFAGLSLGGMTGLGLALDHPDRLLSLACCDARASGNEAYRQSWTDRMALVQAQGIEAVVEPSLSRWFAEGFRTADPARAALVAEMVRGTSAAGYCGAGAALQGLDYGPRLGEIRLPVLYLVGDEDQGAPPAVMREMQAATPGARFVEIPRAGHLSAIEQPEAVAKALRDFLAEAAR